MAIYKNISFRVAKLKLNNDKSVSEICEILNVSERTVRRAFKYYQDTTVDVKLKTLHPDDIAGLPNKEEPEVDVNYSFILTPTFLTISKISGDEKLTETIENADDRFNGVVQGLMESGASHAALKEAFEEISAREQLMKLTMGRVEIDSMNGTVSYSGRPIATRLEARIVEAARSEDGDKLHGLVSFTERLHQNPALRAVDELFSFLEACDIDIVYDGMVVCFKKVRDNYKDCHTGTIDNSVGAEPWMPRWEVDDNSNNTCSHGYHVCSKTYLSYYGGSRVMKVLVDPADFVSIPNDYYGGQGEQVRAKARVCRYKVIAEITDNI